METSAFRLFVYKIDEFGNLSYENSFYSSIGLSGDNKTKEGDKKTPKGTYNIENLYFRKDRKEKPLTLLIFEIFTCFKKENEAGDS